MLRTSEWILIGYFSYLLLTALSLGALRRAGTRGRPALVITGCAASVLCVLALARTPRTAGPALRLDIARDWLPGLLLLIGYWLPGYLRRNPDASGGWLEARLLRTDAVLFDLLGLKRVVAAAPRWVLEYFELAYLFCYPLVPLGCAVVLGAAGRGAIDRFWTVVLAAEFACYGLLPWIQTRTPRELGHEIGINERALSVRRLNLEVLRRGSVQLNTFPSGHTAGAFAVALAVAGAAPAAAPAFFAIAASLSIGSVLGRYHYGLDAALGVAFAIVAWRVFTP